MIIAYDFDGTWLGLILILIIWLAAEAYNWIRNR